MKRDAIKKLELATETLRTLRPGELAHVAGGLGGESAARDTVKGNSCNSCPCQNQTPDCPM